MKPSALLATAVLLAGVLHAGGLEEGDKEAAFSLAFRDSDRGAIGGFELGDEDGPQLTASIAWVRSAFIELGFMASYVDLEGDNPLLGREEQVTGSSPGGFVTVFKPTDGTVSPFVTAAASIPTGDLGDRYKWQVGLSAGVKIYPRERWGLSVFAAYDSVSGEDFVPDANAVSYGAGLLRRF